MPVTKRRRPVVEEIIETPEPKIQSPVHHPHVEAVPEPAPLEVKPQEFTETVQAVASYDEPPQIDKKPEHVAREFLTEMGTEDHKKPNMKFIFVVTILTALIVGFIAGGVYVYVSGVNGNHDTIIKPSIMPSKTPVETVTATSSPKPTVKLDTLTVNVLNGSGIIGAAGKVKDSLTSGGFTVSGTGNAASYNFDKTTIQVKASITPEVVDALKVALKDYQVAVGEVLPDSGKYDIVVTAGKK